MFKVRPSKPLGYMYLERSVEYHHIVMRSLGPRDGKGDLTFTYGRLRWFEHLPIEVMFRV